MDLSHWQFNCGCALSHESQAFLIAAMPGQQFSTQASSSNFLIHFNESWYSYQKELPGPAIAVAAAKSSLNSKWIVVASNPTGRIWVLHPKERDESISQIEGCSSVTNLKAINNHTYACGMGRIVFKLEESGHWRNVSAPSSNLKQGIIGFTDLAGKSEDLIYAVGWQGEIWVKKGDQEWNKEISPTKSNLNAVAVADDETVYVVGDDGVLLRGQDRKWDLIATGIDSNIQDVCLFGNEVYVSTDFDIYRLTSTGLESALFGFGKDNSISCLKLFKNEDGSKMYSVGPNSILINSDSKWETLV